MKYVYKYMIYNRITKEVLETGSTPPYSERVTANNWVRIKAMDYKPMEEISIQMRAGELDKEGEGVLRKEEK